MKQTLTIVLSLFFLTTFATVYNVTNPGAGNDIRANFITAYNSASNGDTIVIPTCSVTITVPTITITKKVKIFGTDSTNTVLYRPEATSDAALENVPIFTIDGSTWSLAESGVKIKGIKFRSKIPSVDDAGADGKSLALDQALSFINVPGFEVTQCAFWYFGNGAIKVKHRDYFARGLIHFCNFYKSAKGLTGLGYGYGVVLYGEGLQWMPYVDASGKNFIFIENNTFNWQSHAIAAGSAAMYVSRYNRFYRNVISASVSKHAIDAHGYQGGTVGSENFFATRMLISYMDTVDVKMFFDRSAYVSNGTRSLDDVMERMVHTRGGEFIVHNTYVRGSRFGFSISSDEDPSLFPYPFICGAGYESGLTYPSSHTGSSYSQISGDAYIWNNTYSVFDGNDGDGTSFYNYEPSYFLDDRDYHLSAKPNYTDQPYPKLGY